MEKSMTDASEKTSPPISAEKFRSNFRHDLRSNFSVLIGLGEVLRDDLTGSGNNSAAQALETALEEARLLLDKTISMINHCPIASVEVFKSEVKSGLGAATLNNLRSINRKLRKIESTAGKQELLTDMIEAVRQLTRVCNAPFKDSLAMNTKASQSKRIDEQEKPADRSRGHVMVIDDEKHNLYLIKTFLNRLNLSVATYSDAKTALDELNTAAADLILLDLHMPEMNGLEFLRTVKARPEFAEIPVLVITASDDAEELAECIEAGAVDSLPKPFQSAFLKARILTSIELQATKKREKAIAEELQIQKNRIEELLEAILPHDVIEELRSTGVVQPRRHESVCVLFCDIVNFTQSCDVQNPEKILMDLQSLFSEFEAICDLHGLQKIKTIGDSLMAAAGLTQTDENIELLAVRAGLDMIACSEKHSSGWKVRVGIHSGPVISGLLGTKQFLFDIWGDTVNTAARIESACPPQLLSASKTTFEKLGSHVQGYSLGHVALKGKGQHEVYVITAVTEPS
jgi:CheY-like chemotaxis protein/class 3 adenylate cyclase